MNHYLWGMRPYFRQVSGQLMLGSVSGIIMNTMIVLPAILLGRAVDAVLALERGEVGTDAVVWAALAYVGGTVLTQGPRMGKRWWLITANGRIRANIRSDALRGVLAWPMARLQSTSIGDLMARIIGDVEVLGVGVREFTIETWDTILFSISLIMAMLFYDAGLTLLALLPVPIAILLAKAAGRWVSGLTTTSREANASLTTALQEQLSGVRVLRLFGRVAAAVELVAQLSRRYADANVALVRLRSGLRPVYTTIMTAGVVLVVWQGSLKTIDGVMTLGAFIAFLELYLRFVNRGFRIPQMINSIQTGGAAYARLRPLLAPPPPFSDEPPYASYQHNHITGLGVPDAAPSANSPGPVAVSLQGVTFHYPESKVPALNDIWLDIPAGALVGVTGPVGSGKSALAKVLLGLYPLESGRMLLNGRGSEEASIARRTANTGYLGQEPFLFSGTVCENILLGSTTAGRAETDTILSSSISCAVLGEDLQGFSAGLETEIGEAGIQVSGGQRQRIALARAIAVSSPQMPGLLVLDDPFSAVDVDIEAKIVSGLQQLFGLQVSPEQRCTIVLFSHRLATFSQADMVVVLEKGRIVERGTHTDLVQAGGLYGRIYRAQLQLERRDSGQRGPL